MTTVFDKREARYVVPNDWEHARRRLQLIEECYDPGTIRRLSHLGVRPGWRCLEVGAGGGSITRWLCEQVGSAGQVLAMDIDTRFVEEIGADNLEVRQVDITTAQLPHGSFDLVHTRAVLMHLPQRDWVLDRLLASLCPGGWLLLEEAEEFGMTSLGSGLYREGAVSLLAGLATAGVDCTWARRLPALLAERGVVDIAAEIDVPYLEGGSSGAELLRLSAIQVRELVVGAGVAPELLDAWDAILAEPGQWFPGFALVAAQGRRPAM